MNKSKKRKCSEDLVEKNVKIQNFKKLADSEQNVIFYYNNKTIYKFLANF